MVSVRVSVRGTNVGSDVLAQEGADLREDGGVVEVAHGARHFPDTDVDPGGLGRHYLRGHMDVLVCMCVCVRVHASVPPSGERDLAHLRSVSARDGLVQPAPVRLVHCHPGVRLHTKDNNHSFKN